MSDQQVVKYKDAQGNDQEYTLKDGESVDDQGLIQPIGLTAEEAAMADADHGSDPAPMTQEEMEAEVKKDEDEQAAKEDADKQVGAEVDSSDAAKQTDAGQPPSDPSDTPPGDTQAGQALNPAIQPEIATQLKSDGGDDSQGAGAAPAADAAEGQVPDPVNAGQAVQSSQVAQEGSDASNNQGTDPNAPAAQATGSADDAQVQQPANPSAPAGQVDTPPGFDPAAQQGIADGSVSGEAPGDPKDASDPASAQAAQGQPDQAQGAQDGQPGQDGQQQAAGGADGQSQSTDPNANTVSASAAQGQQSVDPATGAANTGTDDTSAAQGGGQQAAQDGSAADVGSAAQPAATGDASQSGDAAKVPDGQASQVNDPSNPTSTGATPETQSAGQPGADVGGDPNAGQQPPDLTQAGQAGGQGTPAGAQAGGDDGQGAAATLNQGASTGDAQAQPPVGQDASGSPTQPAAGAPSQDPNAAAAPAPFTDPNVGMVPPSTPPEVAAQQAAADGSIPGTTAGASQALNSESAQGAQGSDQTNAAVASNSGSQKTDDGSTDAATGAAVAEPGTPAADPVNAGMGLTPDQTNQASTAVQASPNTPQETSSVVNDLTQNASATGVIAINTMYRYVEQMAPGREMDGATGARHQAAMYKAVTNIINNLEDDFEDVFRAALKIVEAHLDGAFAMTHAFRFMDEVPLSRDHQQGFTKLIHLMRTAAPVQGRDTALKQIDFSKALENGVTEQGRQRVLAFFNQ